MENFLTSNKPIKGLRHFVLVNKTNEKGNMIFLMVSVLDSEINLKISYEELIKSGNWYKGWIKLPKLESITEEYRIYKSINKLEGIDEILVNENSLPEKLKQNPKLTCVVGLSTEPERLAELRKNRMNSLKETENVKYTDVEIIKKEVLEAKKTFKKYKWPLIDVTRKSVEETAASIIKIHEIYLNNAK